MKPFRCPNCNNETWKVDEETLLEGDKPTEAQCVECGYHIYV